MSEQMKVSGTVSLADGTPLVGLRVLARTETMGGEEVLGLAITDEHGRYEIEGTSPSWRPFTIRVMDDSANSVAVTRRLYASWAPQQVDLCLEAV